MSFVKARTIDHPRSPARINTVVSVLALFDRCKVKILYSVMPNTKTSKTNMHPHARANPAFKISEYRTKGKRRILTFCSKKQMAVIISWGVTRRSKEGYVPITT